MLDDLWNLLENRLFLMPSTEKLFNQYKDVDPRVDLPNAHEIRRGNLMNYLRSFPGRPNILVVGEAAGPWGARFSGIPFTGEKQLCKHTMPFLGRQSSVERPLLETKKEPPYTSQSAEIFWRVMKPRHPRFFVWDCVPFHPHPPNKILRIRNPTKKEISDFSGLLKEIIELLNIKPGRIAAVGRKAECALKEIEVKESIHYVRHPSRGGAREFERGIEKLFRDEMNVRHFKFDKG